MIEILSAIYSSLSEYSQKIALNSMIDCFTFFGFKFQHILKASYYKIIKEMIYKHGDAEQIRRFEVKKLNAINNLQIPQVLFQ